jgi:hypothetical protein
MNNLDCVKKRIRSAVARSSVPEDPSHAENTLEWLLKFKPDADEALRIAALGHDIERAIDERKVRREDFGDYDAFKAVHAKNSSVILREIMEECEVSDPSLINKICRLVEAHEVGGDPGSDLLRDADGISYFDVNLPLYFQREGWDETKRRSIWGYRRLTPRAKEIVKHIVYEEEVLMRLLREVTHESVN